MIKLIKIFIFAIISTVLFGKNIVYEVLPIEKNLENIKIVRVIEGENIGLFGILDNSGKLITKLNNKNIFINENFIYLVDTDKNGGLMQKNGNWIAKMGKFNFKMPHNLKNGKIRKELFIIQDKNTGYYGFLNIKGEIQIPMKYDEVRNFKNGIAPVKKDGKWGYINELGEIVINFQYDEVENFTKGIALVRKGNKKFYINSKGNKKQIKTIVNKVKDVKDSTLYNIISSTERKLQLNKNKPL